MGQLNLSKYEKLSIEQLRTIATEVGINFLMGNENVIDKEDILLALDEADPKELEESYDRVQKSF
jgi:hypothetical protein